MGKYFKFYSAAEYPELNFIREHLGKLGKLYCTDGELYDLWCKFSEENYSAGFMIPDEQIIDEFAEWLSKYDEKETT